MLSLAACVDKTGYAGLGSSNFRLRGLVPLPKGPAPLPQGSSTIRCSDVLPDPRQRPFAGFVRTHFRATTIRRTEVPGPYRPIGL